MFVKPWAQEQAETGGWKRGLALGQLLAPSGTQRLSPAVSNEPAADISTNKKGCRLRQKQNIHKACFSRDATVRVHRRQQEHTPLFLSFFFPSKDLYIGRSWMPESFTQRRKIQLDGQRGRQARL